MTRGRGGSVAEVSVNQRIWTDIWTDIVPARATVEE